MAASAICSVDACGKPVKTAGMCGLHYQRYRRHGDPLAGRALNGEAERFFQEVVLPYEGDDCLFWPYTRNGQGYAQIHKDSRRQLVHRLVCAHAKGAAPTDRREAAHRCGKGHLGCVTKRHLSWKTHTENMADAIGHGTSRRDMLSRLTEEEVRHIRSLKGKMTQHEIGNLFGVAGRTVGSIHRGEKWAWVK